MWILKRTRARFPVRFPVEILVDAIKGPGLDVDFQFPYPCNCRRSICIFLQISRDATWLQQSCTSRGHPPVDLPSPMSWLYRLLTGTGVVFWFDDWVKIYLDPSWTFFDWTAGVTIHAAYTRLSYIREYCCWGEHKWKYPLLPWTLHSTENRKLSKIWSPCSKTQTLHNYLKTLSRTLLVRSLIIFPFTSSWLTLEQTLLWNITTK